MLACKHTADDTPDSSKDHLIYRAPNGLCRLIVYDVDGNVNATSQLGRRVSVCLSNFVDVYSAHNRVQWQLLLDLTHQLGCRAPCCNHIVPEQP